MVEAQGGNPPAPFARARQNGFLFQSGALSRTFESFAETLMRCEEPSVIAGRPGIGKRTILEAFASLRAREGDTPVMLAARALRPGLVAEQVLAAFGQQPAEGSSALLGLADYLADAREARETLFAVVPNLQTAQPECREELAELCRPMDEGGAGLCALISTSDPTLARAFGVPALIIGAMQPGEMRRFIESVLAASGLAIRVSDDAIDAFSIASDSLIGKAGSLLDDAIARLVREEGSTLEARHVMPDASGADVPSASDIERALLDLGSEAAGAPSRSFPRFGEGQPRLPEQGPANDIPPAVDPRVFSALEDIRGDIAHIQGRLELAKTRLSSLYDRHADRRQRIGDSSETLVSDMRNLSGDSIRR
ncbi:hypothetical protein HK107_08040 [Parvularcula sp. ZS-1/3]|uniref:Uncharacterized protein n=1 Tax=Parvularcula mediterranea TaxID=2732508 RepID=A0A7Y3W554_9PROT|nr:hypothetical protein [Parvularcula mediterranea]NNU16269.1 hypothetical protein [Parvularcula mediterranea]